MDGGVVGGDKLEYKQGQAFAVLENQDLENNAQINYQAAIKDQKAFSLAIE